MSSGIEFDSDLRGSGFPADRPGASSGKGLAAWMVRKRLAGSDKQAQLILVVVTLVALAIVAGEWLLFGGGTKASGAKYDPVAETRKAAAQFGKASSY